MFLLSGPRSRDAFADDRFCLGKAAVAARGRVYNTKEGTILPNGGVAAFRGGWLYDHKGD